MQAPFPLEALLRRYKSRRSSVQAIYEQMYQEAQRLVTPKRVQRSFAATELPALAAYLPGAETITLGVCTLGPALEARVAALFDEDAVKAVVLDEIGTRWINELGREMHTEIRAAARAQGKRASPSYRPGIGRWPVELQNHLFTYLPAAEIGVELAHGMMSPRKSISMIVGVGAKLGRKTVNSE